MLKFKQFTKIALSLILLGLGFVMQAPVFELNAQATAPLTCIACKNIPLKKGINLFNWFMGPNIYDAKHAKTYISADDIQALKKMGFTHVRLPIYGKYLANVSMQSAPFYPDHIAQLDNAIQLLQSQNMAVVLTLFAEDESSRLAISGEAMTEYSTLWQALAKRYKSYGSSTLYFELLNEPHFQAYLSDTDARIRWNMVQKSFLSAIRSVTSSHYVIVSSHDWDSVNSVAELPAVLADSKVIYTVHFYEPIAFTHQGIPTFGDPNIRAAHGLPYPVQKEVCQSAIYTFPTITANSLRYYCTSNYNRAWIAYQFQGLVTWANNNHVPVYLGEFGATQMASPPGAAQQWLKDVREISEQYGIPWAYWAYGEVSYLSLKDENGKFKPSIIRALGLNP